MKKLAIIVSMVALQSVANAGSQSPVPVTITPGSGPNTGYTYVQGSVNGAFSSSDPSQNIGCVLTATSGSTVDLIECEASDASGNFAFCDLTDTNHTWTPVVAAINSTSFVSFVFNTSSGECAFLTIENESTFL